MTYFDDEQKKYGEHDDSDPSCPNCGSTDCYVTVEEQTGDIDTKGGKFGFSMKVPTLHCNICKAVTPAMSLADAALKGFISQVIGDIVGNRDKWQSERTEQVQKMDEVQRKFRRITMKSLSASHVMAFAAGFFFVVYLGIALSRHTFTFLWVIPFFFFSFGVVRSLQSANQHMLDMWLALRPDGVPFAKTSKKPKHAEQVPKPEKVHVTKVKPGS